MLTVTKMMNDVSTVRPELVALGDNMKRYVRLMIASIILGAILVLAIFGILANAQSILNSTRISYNYNYSLQNDVAGEIGILVTFLGIPFVLVIIYAFVVYTRIIGNIGKVGRSTDDAVMNRASNAYSAAMIFGFIAILIALCTGIPYIYSSISSNPDWESGSWLSNVSYIITLALLVPSIFQIIGSIALSTWAVTNQETHWVSQTGNNLVDSANCLKWGTILSIFPYIGIVGEVIALIGWFYFGNTLVHQIQCTN